MSATETDEVVSAARELAALLRDNYMLPNTWPASRRFLAAVEALEAPATADGPQSQSQSQSSVSGTDSTGAGTESPAPAPVDVPVDPLSQDKPERRAPLSSSSS